MSRARLGLVAAFTLWSLLLFGSSGVIEWIGNGLVQLLAHIHLGWLGSIIAGLGKALIFIIWLISACAFVIFFALTRQLRRAMQAPSPTSTSQVADATVTLERAPDGSYR
jgi:hypothetical protein